MHKKYFKLSHSTSFEEVGYIPQSNRLIIPLTEAIHRIYNQFTSYPKDGFEAIPHLDKILLDEDAILTDYIDTTYLSYPIGILISEKFYSIIKQLELFDTKTYEAKVTTSKEDVFPYYYIWIKDSSNKIIFPECTYTIGGFMDEDDTPQILDMTINNIDDLTKYADEHSEFPEPAKMILSSSLDIVRIPFDTGIYISEKLKNLIIDNQLTGMEIKAADIEFYVKKED